MNDDDAFEWPGESECLWCREPLRDGESISRVPVHTPVGVRHQHTECAIRSLVGGINHLNGNCQCCGGNLPPDPPFVSRRWAARIAAQAWRARNPR